MLRWFTRELNRLQEVKRDERGFTLIELLVVVIIIGVLAGIAIPVFLNQREGAWEAQAQSNLRNAASAATTCIADTGDADGECETEAKLEDYGYSPDSDVNLTIDTAAMDDDTWVATATHSQGGQTYTFDSDVGQITP